MWRDFLSVIGINITFAQINLSLPSVIDIQFPPEWHSFVDTFKFVNIDLMSLVGISCIREYNYYVSFIIMLCLPISILILAFINYSCIKTSMKLQLLTLSEEEKTDMEEEALHSLFGLADEDNSGSVDASELAGILKALGWKVTIKSAHELVEKICKRKNRKESSISTKHDLFLLSERQFLDAMLSGLMKRLYEEKKKKFIDKMKKHKKKNKKKPKLVASNIKKNRMKKRIAQKQESLLRNRDQLINWTLRTNSVSNSFSGAMQLLLLSHTPVARKVFQFFDCNEIAGRSLLKADYKVDCRGKDYYTFFPLVIIVLMLFVAALPGIISLYLWKNRKNLYSTSIYQRIGWLCKCYNSFPYCLILLAE